MQTVSLLDQVSFVLLSRTLLSCGTGWVLRRGQFSPKQLGPAGGVAEGMTPSPRLLLKRGASGLGSHSTLSLNSRRGIKNSWLLAFCCKADSYSDISSETAQLCRHTGKEKRGENKWLVKHRFEPWEENVRLVHSKHLDEVFHYFEVISLWKKSVLIWVHMYLYEGAFAETGSEHHHPDTVGFCFRHRFCSA